jgi:hypothetical protein
LVDAHEDSSSKIGILIARLQIRDTKRYQSEFCVCSCHTGQPAAIYRPNFVNLSQLGRNGSALAQKWQNVLLVEIL